MNLKMLFLLVAGFILGVGISSFLNLDFGLAALFIFLGAAFIVLKIFLSIHRLVGSPRANFFVGQRRQSEGGSLFLLLAILFIGFGLGVLRYTIKDYRNYELENSVGKEISFQGIIAAEPEEKENYIRLTVATVEENPSVTELTPPNSSEVSAPSSPKNKILIYSRHYPKYQYGDLVLVKGRLQKPGKFNLSPDGGREFDWPAYLAKDDIFYEMFYPKISLIESGQGNFVKSKLFSLKEKFLNNISSVVPEPAASFLGGITVGAKKSIPKNLQDDLIATGIIHIIVLSGYNITIIARAIMLVFEIFTPRIIAALLGGLGIIFFAIMTGGSPTIVRASIMAIIVLLAKNIGRFYHITIALLIAGFLMILHNPKILHFDTSFQLSFLATVGLIYLPSFFEKIKIFKFAEQKMKPPNHSAKKSGAKNRIIIKIRETIIATLSAQLSVTPLLLYTMGNLSVVALPVNLLILLFIPVTMFFGFMTGILGFASQIISVPFAWISYGFLSYELWVVKIFSALPFASVKIRNFPALAAILIYGIMAIILITNYRRKK